MQYKYFSECFEFYVLLHVVLDEYFVVSIRRRKWVLSKVSKIKYVQTVKCFNKTYIYIHVIKCFKYLSIHTYVDNLATFKHTSNSLDMGIDSCCFSINTFIWYTPEEGSIRGAEKFIWRRKLMAVSMYDDKLGIELLNEN